MRAPKHKPDGTDGMQDMHYAALFASFLHCAHTCFRGHPHKVDTHANHAELESYPSEERLKAILQILHTDFVANVDNLQPQFRASFCNAEAQANRLLGQIPDYPFKKK